MIIGVTGKIASGKSSVSMLLKEKGYILFDSDVVYHELLLKNKHLKEELIDFLGPDIIVDNRIDTKIMIKKINQANLGRLNNITHKYVLDEMASFIEQHEKVVIEAAIPVDRGFLDTADMIITTVCSLQTQKQRLKKRNKYTEEELLHLIGLQKPTSQYISISDMIIETDNLTLKELGIIINLLF